jgi:hypothetical protein
MKNKHMWIILLILNITFNANSGEIVKGITVSEKYVSSKYHFNLLSETVSILQTKKYDLLIKFSRSNNFQADEKEADLIIQYVVYSKKNNTFSKLKILRYSIRDIMESEDSVIVPSFKKPVVFSIRMQNTREITLTFNALLLKITKTDIQAFEKFKIHKREK